MKFRAELDPLAPYNPPKADAEAEAERAASGGLPNDGDPGGSPGDFIKLTSNELSFGPIPEAEAALAEALPRANRYPDRYARSLREAVVQANSNSSFENILVGNGSSEVLQNLLMLVEKPGEVIAPSPTFGLYRTICTTLGLDFKPVPLAKDYCLDPDEVLRAVTDMTRAVILCNPNNPTGTYLDLETVTELADALPEDVLLILDEAYQDFVSDPAYHGSHELALLRDNVVAARTFSKAHGLAGFRVGYGIASEKIADYAERVRFPFSVNLAAQVAAAASMGAKKKIQARADFVISERGRVQRAFGDAGLRYIPSQGNYVLVEIGAEVFERNGVLIREGDPLGFPGWSRVTIGNEKENDRVIASLSDKDATSDKKKAVS